jgi:hypothetical protein
MKSIILIFIISIFTTISLTAQKSTFTQNISKLKVSNSLKAKAITAYQATKDPCWDGDGPVTKDCSDLKDPWGDDTEPVRPPADTSARLTAFYAFEEGLLNGDGGLLLPEKIVRDAWKKHPGYSLKAMRARVEIYNLKIDK